MSNTDDLTALNYQIKKCTKCKISQARTQVVLSEGSINTNLMFVGEAPGAKEDEYGRPFVGAAGRLMDKIINATGWKREDIFISNIIKCRPPNNRNPLPNEISNCLSWLQTEIELVNPKVIVCWGSTAANTLIHSNFKITQEHGQWFEIDGRKLIAVYHPAYVLRKTGGEFRNVGMEMWDDI